MKYVKLCSGEKAKYDQDCCKFLLTKVESLKYDKIRLSIPNEKFATKNLEKIYFGMWSNTVMDGNVSKLILPKDSTISYEAKICNARTNLDRQFDLSQLEWLSFTHFYGEMMQ